MKIVIEFMLWEVKPDGTVEMMSLKVSAVPTKKADSEAITDQA